MSLLGRRLKTRRRQYRLTQQQLAISTTASFISRVERGHDLPSIQVLSELAASLDTTAGELLGDILVLEAAKLTILNPNRCCMYLQELPSTSITRYLASLTTSVQKKSPVPPPPQHPEMHFLAALAYASRGEITQAIKTARTGLSLPSQQPLTKLRLELLQDALAKPSAARHTPELLKTKNTCWSDLPPPELITFEDVVSGLVGQVFSLVKYSEGTL